MHYGLTIVQVFPFTNHYQEGYQSPYELYSIQNSNFWFYVKVPLKDCLDLYLYLVIKCSTGAFHAMYSYIYEMLLAYI